MATITGFNRSTSQAQTQSIQGKVKEIVGKMHPAAIVAWAAVALFILLGLLFTGYHNYELYRRGMGNSSIAGVVAFVPPFLLDGGIAVLLVLLLTYFRDGLQWLAAVIFNIVLFVIVIFNTSLNFSLNAGEVLSNEMRVYLHWGPLGAIVFALVMYELLIHLDPKHRQAQEMAKITAKAAEDAHGLEVAAIQFDVQEQQAELQYQLMLRGKMHDARMKAVESQDVEGALVDFEKREAIERAKQIRGAHSTQNPNGQSRP